MGSKVECPVCLGRGHLPPLTWRNRPHDPKVLIRDRGFVSLYRKAYLQGTTHLELARQFRIPSEYTSRRVASLLGLSRPHIHRRQSGPLDLRGQIHGVYNSRMFDAAPTP